MTCLTVADRGSCVSARLAESERPKYALLRLLGEKGYYKLFLAVRVERSRLASDPFQEVALQILVWNRDVVNARREGRDVACEEYSGLRYTLLLPGEGSTSDGVLTRGRGVWRSELLSLVKVKPLIAIDMSLLWRHHPKELPSLRKQIAASLGVVRRYLWDRHLLLAGLPRGGYEWVKLLIGRGEVQVSPLPSDEALALRGATRIILLDPSAEEPLTPRDVLEADAFIVGGIVDRIPRPGETGRLQLKGGIAVPRRILFHGDVHGVPNRINMIIEIILKARYIYCGDIDRAIASTMSRRDAILRAMIEISRWSRGRKTAVPMSLYEQLRKWLPITPEDFRRAVHKLGLRVEDQQRPNSS